MGNKCCRNGEDLPIGGCNPGMHKSPIDFMMDPSKAKNLDPKKQNGGVSGEHGSSTDSYEEAVPLHKFTAMNDTVTAMALWEQSNHGSRLVCGDASGHLHWYQLGTRMSGVIHEVHDKAISSLCALQCGFLATGSADKSIQLINPGKMSIRHRLTGHNFRVNALACGYENHLLYSGGRDGTVRVWDCNLGKQMHSVWTEGNHVTSISPFRNVGRGFLQTSEEPVVRVWAFEGGADLTQVSKFDAKIPGQYSSNYSLTSSDATPDGFYFAVGTRGDGAGTCNLLVFDVRKASSGLQAMRQGGSSSSIPNDAGVGLVRSIEIGDSGVQNVKFVTSSSVLSVCNDGSIVRANFNTGLTTVIQQPSQLPRLPGDCDTISASLILPRLRKRRVHAVLHEWPVDSPAAASGPNAALVVTAATISPLTQAIKAVSAGIHTKAEWAEPGAGEFDAQCSPVRNSIRPEPSLLGSEGRGRFGSASPVAGSPRGSNLGDFLFPSRSLSGGANTWRDSASNGTAAGSILNGQQKTDNNPSNSVVTLWECHEKLLYPLQANPATIQAAMTLSNAPMAMTDPGAKQQRTSATSASKNQAQYR